MTLRWVPGWNGLTEPEAVSYVAAVEAADGQELEFGVAKAINDFVLGCKNDRIWDAIKASCILAGARTLSGALVPLVGTAPTPYFFVEGDYDRETGLVGDGSTKYLDSNRNSNSDPNSNIHQSIFISTAHASGVGSYIGVGIGDTGATHILANLTLNEFGARNRSSNADVISGAAMSTGFAGTSRNNSSTFLLRVNNLSSSFTRTADPSTNANHFVLARNGVTNSFTTGRLAFYSIGESLDLALLDTRVSALITAIGAAIP
jgi:hypothetical protein